MHINFYKKANGLLHVHKKDGVQEIYYSLLEVGNKISLRIFEVMTLGDHRFWNPAHNTQSASIK